MKLSRLSSGGFFCEELYLACASLTFGFCFGLRSIMPVAAPETLVTGLGVFMGVSDLKLRGSAESISLTSLQTALPAKEICIVK